MAASWRAFTSFAISRRGDSDNGCVVALRRQRQTNFCLETERIASTETTEQRRMQIFLPASLFCLQQYNYILVKARGGVFQCSLVKEREKEDQRDRAAGKRWQELNKEKNS